MAPSIDLELMRELRYELRGLDDVEVVGADYAVDGAVEVVAATLNPARVRLRVIERFGAGRVRVVTQPPRPTQRPRRASQSADYWEVEVRSPELLGPVLPYIREHEFDFAGTWRTEDRTPVIGVAAGLERHRAAIDPRILLVAVPLAHHDFEAIGPAARAMVDGYYPELIRVSESHKVAEGHVKIAVIGPDPEPLRAALAERFGPYVQLDVRGLEIFREAMQRFDSWSVDETGRTLTVHWMGHGGKDMVLEVDERPTEVRAQVRLQRYAGLTTMSGHSYTLSATMTAPLGNRAVIDETSDTPRPRHSPPRPFGH